MVPERRHQFLPGWALNAAYIIHSDEALLATGFIFLFHFFHTHLRPESFPMDPVIFTGSMPLHRFKEERPLEYQRLVDSNTLEQYFVPPPSKAHIQIAHVFGFAAVARGHLAGVPDLQGDRERCAAPVLACAVVQSAAGRGIAWAGRRRFEW